MTRRSQDKATRLRGATPDGDTAGVDGDTVDTHTLGTKRSGRNCWLFPSGDRGQNSRFLQRNRVEPYSMSKHPTVGMPTLATIFPASLVIVGAI